MKEVSTKQAVLPPPVKVSYSSSSTGNRVRPHDLKESGDCGFDITAPDLL